MFKPFPHLFALMLLVTGSGLVYGQDQSKFAVTIHAALNNSDMNYGSEFIELIVPRDDYRASLYGGSPGFGFDLGAGITYNITPKVSVPFNIYYGRYGYKVEGSVEGFDPPDNRPINPEFIKEAEGQVNYSFAGIQTGVTYHFNEDIRKGFNMTLLFDYMIQTGAGWNLDVIYEDDGTGEFDDNSALDDVELNNIFTLGLRLGYRIPVGESYSVVPRFTFRGGLNPISDDSINPAFFDLGVTVMRWF